PVADAHTSVRERCAVGGLTVVDADPPCIVNADIPGHAVAVLVGESLALQAAGGNVLDVRSAVQLVSRLARVVAGVGAPVPTGDGDVPVQAAVVGRDVQLLLGQIDVDLRDDR